MGLMDRETWDGKVFVGGGWVPGSDGDYAVVEPATGDELARMGKASTDDVAAATASAADAQRAWACGSPA
jgi:benzaldehyde dehydrogenase (NAD)